ncbi:MAG: hypothetical protein AVDCRST_MAG01-01-2553, partial [uncultured Rubrobacteraceae bacterium]
VAAGGFALALALSFPVRALSRFLPRPAAILVSFVVLALLVLLVFSLLVPALADQISALLEATPRLARQVESTLRGVMEPLAERGLLPGTPDEMLAGLAADLFGRIEGLVQGLLADAFRFAGRAFYFVVGVLGALVVASYMLADVRKIKAAWLHLSPKTYRRDARELWDAFGDSLGRYLSGLVLLMAVQGVLSALALWALGVPYAAALGLWVALTAAVPLLGAWIGAVPGILVALSVSPATAAAVAVVSLTIQQIEGNLLTPRVMGDAIRIHPVLILLSVIGGGQLAGPAGIVLAVPALAVGRVLLDFIRPRLRVTPATAPSGGPSPDG